MTEKLPRIENAESQLEIVPTEEEIMAIFEELAGSKEYTAGQKFEDTRGVYRWEIRVETTDGYTEYEYNLAGPHQKGKYLQTAVYATFYDKDDFPGNGSTVAKLLHGKWNTNLIPIDPSVDYQKNLTQH